MNGPTHRTVGVVSGILAAGVIRNRERKDIRFGELVGAGFGGAVGAALPDILEPAISSYHRAFAYSVRQPGG